MSAPVFRTAERGARGARPELPRLGAVLLEQIRATGLALRAPALIAAALLALLTIWVALQHADRDARITLNAWPTQLPGVIGALLPIAVWARDERFGPGFLWTLPVDRRWHACTKVLAGWIWMMGGVALFVLWLLALTSATGGRALPPETLYVLAAPVTAAAVPVDPAALRTVRWLPGLLIWAVPFTAATATYLLASALTLGSRHPLRWVIGTVLTYMLSSVASQAASTQLGASWLNDAPGRLLSVIASGPYGLDAVLTARIESLSIRATLTTGESVAVWWEMPDLADWRTATLLWTVAGLLAVWAAASRHRERRRD
jgi:hypothetical protein